MKLVMLRGVEELEKLLSSTQARFKFAMPKCSVELRKGIYAHSADTDGEDSIIAGTADFIVICRMHKGEDLPADLARVYRVQL